jgi:hypothetical protein
MFGVRIVVFASALFGAVIVVPNDPAEAKPALSTKGTYSQYLRKSYVRHHAPESYAKRHVRKPYAKYTTRKSYAAHGSRRSYADHGSRKPAAKLRVRASASASAGVGARPARWCGWWLRTQLGGGPELNLARNWKNWGRPSGPQVGAVVVWSHHVGVITGRAANGQWIVKSGNDGGRVRERPRSVAGAVFRTSA